MSAPPPAIESAPHSRSLADRWARWLILASCVCPVVVVWGVLLYPQTTGRVAFLRLLALFALPVAAYLLANGRRVTRSPFVGALGLWAVVLIVSTAMSSDVQLSLWGTQSRLFGVVSSAACGVLALVALLGLRTRSDWRPVGVVFLAFGAVVGVHALLEQAGWVPQMDALPERASSFFGNPTFLAGYALFVVFLAGLAAARARRPGLRLAASAVAVLGALSIVASESRATAAALAVGALVSGLAYLIGRRGSRRVRIGVIGAVLVSAVAVAGLWAVRDQPFVQRVPVARRLAGLTLASPAVERRLHLWNVAIEAGLERPIVGWGPRTYSQRFDQNYPPRLFVIDPDHPWADRAHCEPANAFAEQGVLGLLAYLGLLGAPVLLLLRRFERGETDVPALVAGFGLMTSVFLHGLFAFDSVETFAFLLLYGAFVHGDRPADANGVETPESRPLPGTGGRMRLALVGAAVLAAGVLCVPLVVWPIRSTALAATANSALATWPQDVTEILDRALRAPNLGAADATILLTQSVVARAAAVEAAGRGPDLRRVLQRLDTALAEVCRNAPQNLRALTARAALVERQATLFRDQSNVPELIEQMTRAAAASPTRPDFALALASLSLAAGRQGDAVQWADRAVEIEPFAAESIWRAAEILARAGQGVRARSLVRDARRAGILFDEAGRRVTDRLDPPIAGRAQDD